jgi:hypothetical protein
MIRTLTSRPLPSVSTMREVTDNSHAFTGSIAFAMTSRTYSPRPRIEPIESTFSRESPPAMVPVPSASSVISVISVFRFAGYFSVFFSASYCRIPAAILKSTPALPISAVPFAGSPDTPESRGPPHGLI